MFTDRLSTGDFVGRSAELAIFDRAIADARNGLPSLVLVSGDVGIGKTSIVGEAAARAGVALYLGRSTHIGGDIIPLAPLADLLRRVRRTRPQLSSDVPGLGALHRWLAPDTVGHQPTDAPQAGVFSAVLELLAHLTGSADPVMVGFEDLHWADAATWDLFEYLARNLIDEQVVLVGTYRANEVGVRQSQRRRLAELTRLPSAHLVHLEGLDRDEIEARISSLIGSP